MRFTGHERIARRFTAGLLLLMSCLFGMTSLVIADDRNVKTPAVDLKKLTLNELATRLESSQEPGWLNERERQASRDALLLELIRRGDRFSEQVIVKCLNDRERRRLAEIEKIKNSSKDDDEERFDINQLDKLARNLEFVTAICRIRKQPDPLAVYVHGSADIKASLRKPPVLKVSLKNVDIDNRPLWITYGGDNRSGRHDRWRIHVWNNDGILLPEVDRFSMIGGGIFVEGPLPYNKNWEAQLNFASYVKIRNPGKYKVQVLYHDNARIADESVQGLDQLIVFKSEPFEMTVHTDPRIEIRLTRAEMDEALLLVKSLNAEDPLRIIYGAYDQSARRFIRADTPQGKLLALNLKAAPALLQALSDEKLTFRKRAWLITILSTIIAEPDLDPLQIEVDGDFQTPSTLLPDYEIQERITSSATSASGSSFTILPAGEHKSGTPDIVRQQALGRAWMKFGTDNLDIQIKN